MQKVSELIAQARATGGSNVKLIHDLTNALEDAIGLPHSGWLGGHCRFKGHRHEDCPGDSFNRPCICWCHRVP